MARSPPSWNRACKPASGRCRRYPLMEGGVMRNITFLVIALALLATLVVAGCGGGSY
jgi:hypothetical protein